MKNLKFEASEPLPIKDIEYQTKQKDKSSKTCIIQQSWLQSIQL